MPLVPAKCPECGGNINIDSSKKAAVCEYCKQPFIVQEAINNFNTTYNIVNNNDIKADVVNVYDSSSNADNLLVRAKDFIDSLEMDKAEEYLNKVLDIDAGNEQARQLLNQMPELRDLVKKKKRIAELAKTIDITVKHPMGYFVNESEKYYPFDYWTLKCYLELKELDQEEAQKAKEKLEEFFTKIRDMFMSKPLPHENERPYKEDFKSPYHRGRMYFGLPLKPHDDALDSEYSIMKHMLSKLETSIYSERQNLDKEYFRETDISSLNQIVRELDSIHSFKWDQLENNGIYGNYAIHRYQYTSKSYPHLTEYSTALVALDRTVTDGYQLKDYMEEVFNEVKWYILANAYKLKQCPICNKKSTMFGKCTIVRCANYGKKLYSRDGTPNMSAAVPKSIITP